MASAAYREGVPVAQKCIRDIRAVTDLPVIGCGGVSSKEDVTAMRSAGAEIIGVGSALTGMTTEEMRDISPTSQPRQARTEIWPRPEFSTTLI